MLTFTWYQNHICCKNSTTASKYRYYRKHKIKKISLSSINKRSWLLNGFEDSITNLKYSGSLSFISWIVNSDWSLNSTVSKNISSRLFIKYLLKLKKAFSNIEWYSKEENSHYFRQCLVASFKD